MPQNRIPLKSHHREGERLEDRRNVGKNSCNTGEGTDVYDYDYNGGDVVGFARRAGDFFFSKPTQSPIECNQKALPEDKAVNA